MGVDIPQNPFIDVDRGSCYNQTAFDLVTKMVAKADLSWEDFMPALQFAYNTSYQSSLASSPFELLYGYKPSLPKSSSEANSVPVTFAQERLHIFKNAKNLLIDERRQEAQVQNDQLHEFI